MELPQVRGLFCRDGDLVCTAGSHREEAINELGGLQIGEGCGIADKVTVGSILLEVSLVKCNEAGQILVVELVGSLDTVLLAHHDLGVEAIVGSFEGGEVLFDPLVLIVVLATEVELLGQVAFDGLRFGKLENHSVGGCLVEDREDSEGSLSLLSWPIL